MPMIKPIINSPTKPVSTTDKLNSAGRVGAMPGKSVTETASTIPAFSRAGMAALPSRGAVIIMPDTRVATSRNEGSVRLSSISDVGYTVDDHSVTKLPAQTSALHIPASAW